MLGQVETGRDRLAGVPNMPYLNSESLFPGTKVVETSASAWNDERRSSVQAQVAQLSNMKPLLASLQSAIGSACPQGLVQRPKGNWRQLEWRRRGSARFCVTHLLARLPFLPHNIVRERAQSAMDGRRCLTLVSTHDGSIRCSSVGDQNGVSIRWLPIFSILAHADWKTEKNAKEVRGP